MRATKKHRVERRWTRWFACWYGVVFVTCVQFSIGSEDHWSFKPPVRPLLPAVQATDWLRTPIDAFVLARLENAGASPLPVADRYTLIRRLSLDLTGLPPTIEEVDAFVADDGPDVYDKLVERLLASPRFGERWAHWWLDAVRFADTNGYEIDRPRSMWLYRDWVVEAFNQDQNFDQFAVDQVAGDLLPEPTLAQRIATGFHRNTFMNEEGGHDWEQFRWESIVDRVHTTSTVFLGLTLACAQCHDHKYDPVTQAEYYRFFALLNNDDEPFLKVPVESIVREQERIDAQVDRLTAQLVDRFPEGDDAQGSDSERRRQNLEEKFVQWCTDEAKRVNRWQVLDPLHFSAEGNATLTKLDDLSILATGDRPELDTYEVAAHVDGRPITGFRLEALPHPKLPHYGPGRGSVMQDGTFALTEFTVSAKPVEDSAAPSQSVSLRNATSSEKFERRPIEKAIDGDRLTSWHIAKAAGRRHVAVFETAAPLEATKPTELSFSLLHNFIHQQCLGRFRLSVTSDPTPLVASPRPVEIESILLVSPSAWTSDQRAELKKYFLSVTPELEEQHKKIKELAAQRPLLPTTMVVEKRHEMRPTYFHRRGEFSRPGDRVSPGVPALLHPLPTGGESDRLSLARWLVDGKNPLVGRVIMNQLWQAYFGQGLVTTPEDFGTQGERPTHPLLLDWLATEFVRSGWSLKAMHRLIVSSSVYRQSSRATIALHTTDPENKALGRGARFRVDAEVIRDSVLFVSGLLHPAVGGPSVFPPQPAVASELVFGGKWNTSEGNDRYRRGLYTFRKRTAPYAAFQLFDAPTRNTCQVKRERSNTPLQSLALLNDEVVVESARSMAKRIVAHRTTAEAERIIYAFRLCLARPPDDVELSTLVDFYRRQRARFEAGNADSAAVVGVKPEDMAADERHELAAWTLVARTLLNLDEMVTRE